MNFLLYSLAHDLIHINLILTLSNDSINTILDIRSGYHTQANFMKPGIARLRDLLLAMRRERWHSIFVLGVVIVLAILLASSIVLNLYQITTLAITSNQEKKTIHQYQQKIKIDTATPDAVNMADWHLFGSPPVVTTVASGNFTLIGIEYSYLDPANAKAIISNNSGDEGIYRVGDQLPQGGGIIEKIESKQVTLLFNGTLEVLAISWDDEKNIQHTPDPQSAADELTHPQNNSLVNTNKPELKNTHELGTNKYD
jgi:hypothetical protein